MDPSTRQLFRLKGLRITFPRMSVFELLQTHEQLSAREAYLLLNQAGKTVAPATLQRALAELCGAALIERHHLAPGMTSFSISRQLPLAHLVCMDCGSIKLHEDPALQTVVDHVFNLRQFVVRELTVSLRGICADCAAKR